MKEGAIRQLFLDFSTSMLDRHSSSIEKCLGQLSDQHVWARGGDNENAVGNLVLHLCGNVRQAIIAGIGGEPDTRQRSEEFSVRSGMCATELRELLHSTVTQAISVIRDVS